MPEAASPKPNSGAETRSPKAGCWAWVSVQGFVVLRGQDLLESRSAFKFEASGRAELSQLILYAALPKHLFHGCLQRSLKRLKLAARCKWV